MTIYHLTLSSANVKTGPIPVSTTSAETCPDSCPLKQGGCYAKSGPLGLHWAAVTNNKRGGDFDAFIKQIEGLPRDQLWRHNQAGDLPGDNLTIDAAALSRLVHANKNKRGFTYTHKPLTAENQAAIKAANQNGFTINLSANRIQDVDGLAALNIGPVVTILPEKGGKVTYTSGGLKVVTCPAQTNNKTTCATCGLCQKVDRGYAIGFIVHGTGKKKAIQNLGV